METYYLSLVAQTKGEHEVHVASCVYLPERAKREFLGVFENCHEAIKRAKDYFDNVDGCAYCCSDCHKR